MRPGRPGLAGRRRRPLLELPDLGATLKKAPATKIGACQVFRATIAELRVAANNAERVLREIRARHPPFMGYLVLSSRLGQAPVDGSVSTMLRKFPAMFFDNEAKPEAIALARRLAAAEDPPPYRRGPADDKDALRRGLKALEPLFFVDGTVLIEIRFGPDIKQDPRLSSAERGNLVYSLIAELQQDPLVDQTLTPRDGTSIRIVLGRVIDFLPPVRKLQSTTQKEEA